MVQTLLRQLLNLYKCNKKKTSPVENCKNMGTIFKREISYLCNKYPSVYKEIRGTGLFKRKIYGKTLVLV